MEGTPVRIQYRVRYSAVCCSILNFFFWSNHTRPSCLVSTNTSSLATAHRPSYVRLLLSSVFLWPLLPRSRSSATSPYIIPTAETSLDGERH